MEEQAGRAISRGPHDLLLTVENAGRVEAMFLPQLLSEEELPLHFRA